MAKIIDTNSKHESSFYTDKKDSAGKKFTFKEETLDSNGKKVEVITISTTTSSGYYYTTKHTKDLIVLHHTAGQLKGDISALTKKDNHVSVAYVLARDGRIYRLFDDAYWSYHLGKGAKGGNGTGSKRSVAIEISNFGWLKKNGNKLETYTGGHYCDITDTAHYKKLDKKWREYEYYATFTTAQYDSLLPLLKYIADKHKISYKFIDEKKRHDLFANDDTAKKFKGISSHANYRSGKWDLGPVFDWTKIANTPATPAVVPAIQPAPLVARRSSTLVTMKRPIPPAALRPKTRAISRYSVFLRQLKCEQTEDFVTDECRLKIYIDGTYSSNTSAKREMKKGQIWNLNKRITFHENLEIQLWDEDLGNALDRDDHMGTIVITPESMKEKGTKSGTLSLTKGRYTLNWTQ